MPPPKPQVSPGWRPYLGVRSRGAVVSDIAHAECLETPATPTRGAWWETLDHDFYKKNERFRLAWGNQLRVEASATIDIAIRTSAAFALLAFAAPAAFTPAALRQAREDAAFYDPFIKAADPGRFFEAPSQRAAIRIRKATPTGFNPRDGQCESLRFESPFVPKNPRFARTWHQNEGNRFAHVRYWHHHDGPRPTIIAIHGFGAEGYALNQWFFALPWFYEHLGLDVALFNLPFHGRRQARFSPFSGHGFFAGGLSHINEAAAQGVFDFRVLLDYLLEVRVVPSVGVTGVSLGGFTSALLAATEPRLKFALPNVPVASLADVVLDWEPLGTAIRAAMKRVDMDIVEARRLLAVSSPLTWPSLLPRQRLMVIGGVGDRLVPPNQTRLLWDHWGRPRLHWFPGSHVLHINRTDYHHEVEKFLGEIAFLPR